MYSPPKVWVQGPAAKEPQAKTPYLPGLPMALPLGATMMTAASGGNRESLLGPRPARRKRSAADAGCRNPFLARKRLRGYKKAHRHSPVTDCQCALRHFVLFRPALFGSILSGSSLFCSLVFGLSRLFLSGGGGILAEQQTLVLVQLLLTAVQIDTAASAPATAASVAITAIRQDFFIGSAHSFLVEPAVQLFSAVVPRHRLGLF